MSTRSYHLNNPIIRISENKFIRDRLKKDITNIVIHDIYK